jgi:hypothetical protein
MPRPRNDRRLNLDWVSVRYRSVVLFVLAVGGILAASWVIWAQYHERTSPRTLASREIEAAEQLYREAVSYGDNPDLNSIRSEARQHLADSRTLFNDEHYDESRVKAILSRNNSQKVIDIARSGETTRTEVRFYRINGEVKVKRAGNLLWETADIDQPLRRGDAIKTSSRSSAEIIYFDGSLTTVKPGSLVEITDLVTDPDTRQVRVTESLKVGGVRSAAFGSKADGSFHAVATENSVARAATSEPTEFEVDYDARRQATRVSVHTGEAALSAGEKSVILAAAERMSVAGEGQFGRRERILSSPRLLAPGDRKIFVSEPGEQEPVRLVWSEVPGAREYQVQVSRHSLMADLAHDLTLTGKSNVELAGLAEGQWYWRVAAVDTHGDAGRFSPVAEFRMASPASDLAGDQRPPVLDVTEFLQTGNLVIINGRTDPDAHLWVDNLKVDVYEDGSFTAVVRLHREGRNQLEIVAQDPAGNETVARREAFLEVF